MADSMADQETEESDVRPASKSTSPAKLLPILVIGLMLATIFLIGIKIGKGTKRIPRFTRTEFDDAWAKWRDAAPADYRIKTLVEGPTSGEYEVVVREGQVVSATRNGTPLTQSRTVGTWSVPGMFETIESDVETTEEKQPKLDLSLRADFDEQWGMPRRYLRSDYTSKTEVRWKVLEFEPAGTTMLPSTSNMRLSK